MLWNLALRTLLCDRGKLLAGMLGVVFSVVLVNIQGGLFNGMISKASFLVDRSNADIWVGSHGMHNVDFPHDLPERWIHRVRGVPGVVEAEPIRVGFAEMMLPSGGHEDVVVIGLPQHSDLGRVFEVVEGASEPLRISQGIVVDQCDDAKLEAPRIGDLRQIGGHRARVVAKSHGVLSFLVSPYLFTRIDQASLYCKRDPTKVSYFLVRVSPTARISDVCREINRRLPSAAVMPAGEYAAISVNFWTTRTGIGMSFGAAAGLGLLVGLVMVAQTLYAMVLDRVSEYATLKAIGATEPQILVLLISQATCIATAGIGVGIVLSSLIGWLLSTPRATIDVPLTLYLVSGLLVFAICLFASGLPYLRLRRVDPHLVLQGM